MTLTSTQQRLIQAWFQAAKEGRQLVFGLPKSGMTHVLQRIREIEEQNPHLFPAP